MAPLQRPAYDQMGADQGSPPDPNLNGGGIPQDLSFLFEEQAPGIGEYKMGPDGLMALVVPEDDMMPAGSSGGHTENLAESLDEQFLSKCAHELLERIEEDIESRGPWRERFRTGMEMMGLIPDEVDDGPFPGSSTAVMPIISEAAVQFWARSLAEQVPSDGPVKGKVLGKATAVQSQRADRIATYMNHDLMFLDRCWYADHSRMLFALPLHGSCFKKTYRDHDAGRNTGQYISAEDFICNYSFTHLEGAPRFTHRIWRTKNEMRKAVVAGVYRDIPLGEPGVEELPEETEIQIEIADFDSGQDSMTGNRHELYEVYCEYDVPGHPDLGEDGQATGIALPYIVTIDKRSEKIVGFYRNWKEPDPLKRRRINFTKYDFLPGVGFYGLGFFHLIGGLQQAATGALRAVLDGAATASLQGGFISKDASLKDQSLVIEPGVWKQLDATSEDLNKAFFTPPFKEPSPVLFQVIGYLTQRAEKFTSTTEAMTGGQDTKGAPVGSTMAMIEQGSKVFSTVHRGLHRSLAEELRLRFELIQEFTPQEGYPFDVEGAHEGLFMQDFAPGVSVLPVSDPNIFTQAQRIALAQAVYDLAQQNPDLIKRPVAIRRVLEGLNVPDVDELLIGEQGPPPPMDPVSEIQALLRGDPVQAYPDQDHLAHIQHYWAFMNNPQFGGNPQVQERIGPPAVALLGQRLAFAWAAHAQALGSPAPMLPTPQDGGIGMQPGMQAMQPPMQPNMQGIPPSMGPEMGAPNGGMHGPIPPQYLAQIAAQIAPQMVRVPGLPAMDSPDQGKAQAEMAKVEMQGQAKQAEIGLKQEAMQGGMQLKAQEQAFKLQLAQQQADIKLQMEQIKGDMKLQLEAMQAESQAKLEEQKANMQAAQVARQMQRDEERAQIEQVQAINQMQATQQKAVQDGAVQAAQAEQSYAQAQQDMQIKRQESQTRQSVMKQPKPAPKKGSK